MKVQEAVKYLIVIEKARRGYSAYSPDLPGCVAAGPTRARTESGMRKAIAMHIQALRAEEVSA